MTAPVYVLVILRLQHWHHQNGCHLQTPNTTLFPTMEDLAISTYSLSILLSFTSNSVLLNVLLSLKIWFPNNISVVFIWITSILETCCWLYFLSGGSNVGFSSNWKRSKEEMDQRWYAINNNLTETKSDVNRWSFSFIEKRWY